jgi:quinohemoprotein ethanol dehydrogenase
MTVSNIPPSSAAAKYQNVNRIIAFKLGGSEVPTPPALVVPPVPKPPVQTGTPALIHSGEVKFIQECSRCHVFGPSVTPDLRRLDPGLQAIFKDIVLKGAVAPTGMERFDDILSEADVEAIHDYLIDESWKAYRMQEAAAAKH